jgi:hypothetical protein
MKCIVTVFLILSLSIQAQDGIFLSEYFEGNSEQKAIEIYNGNPGQGAIDLNRLKILVYSNGATLIATLQLGLADDGTTTSLAWNNVFVVYRNSASGFPSPGTELPNAPSARRFGTTSDVTQFNGDEAIELQYDVDGTGTTWATADILGVIGEDPGSAWTGGGISTLNSSIERKSSINTGVQSNPGSFDPSVEWNDNNNITPPITTLGQHTTDSPLPVALASFTTSAGNNRVTLRWVTESELENVGFKIMRANEKNGEYILRESYENNPALQGRYNTSERTVYTFVDEVVINDATYWYKLVDVDANGIHTEHGPISATPHAVGDEITTISNNAPKRFELYPNFPNPFNPSTTLRFDIPSLKQETTNVEVSIFNTQGQLVKTLYSGQLPTGTHELQWNGDSDNGGSAATGMYYGLLKMNNLVKTIKLLLLK